jgi:hypothetical protein
VDDEIIKELWTTKDDIAKEFHCDVKALAAHLHAKQHIGDQEVVDLRSVRQKNMKLHVGADPQRHETP